MDFGIRLKALRVERKLTQLQMAKILDVSKSNISKYEGGTVEPNLETLIKISKYFDVPTDYLLGNEIAGDDYVTPESLSPDEKYLLSAFSQCSEECQRYLIAKAQVLSVEGISAVTEYRKYIDEGKKSHPLHGTEGTEISKKQI